MNRPPISISAFAEQIVGRPLYPYQREIAEAILDAILSGNGGLFTVMLARQSGKNQLSAMLEAYLLTYMPQGTIIKAAATFSPQIAHSRERLLSLLDNETTRERIWIGRENMIGLAPEPDATQRRNHVGPRVMFLSAAPESNVVGATASLLLEIDEAQDVMPNKFDRDFRPMASTTNATTVLYGTAWSDITLLALQRTRNLQWEERTGQRRHFQYDWRALAEHNPAYSRFVETEIERLGEEHIAIQTQYFLRPISDAGRFFTSLQHLLLQGEHHWEEVPEQDEYYIAGMDVGGEERLARGGTAGGIDMNAAAGKTRHDSTVISVARVRYNRLNLPQIEVVHQYCWTGMPYLEQYAATAAIAEHWGLRRLVIDATGLGASFAALLVARLGSKRVLPFTFTRPDKSHLAYQWLALLNSGRFKIYDPTYAPPGIANECRQQLQLARYRLPAPDTLDFYVDPSEGHDDFLTSLALLGEALIDIHIPTPSVVIRPRPLYRDDGRF